MVLLIILQIEYPVACLLLQLLPLGLREQVLDCGSQVAALLDNFDDIALIVQFLSAERKASIVATATTIPAYARQSIANNISNAIQAARAF